MFRKLSSGLDIAIQKAVEQARDTNFFEASTTGRGVYPFINLFEKEGDLVLAAELPGIKKERLTLEVRKDVLRLAGARKIEYGEDCSCHRLERKGLNFDDPVKSLKSSFSVIPAKAGIQCFQILLDACLRRHDEVSDFLRGHQL